MTDWTQFHPTQTLTTPGGLEVDIDLEMIPLVQELWRLGVETRMACQDAGEAVREGGTRTIAAERPQVSARLMGRAWLMVRREDVPRLLGLWSDLGQPADWVARPVKKDTAPGSWASITFPRPLIGAAAQTLHSTEVDDLRRLTVAFDRTGGRALSPEAPLTRLQEMIEAHQ